MFYSNLIKRLFRNRFYPLMNSCVRTSKRPRPTATSNAAQSAGDANVLSNQFSQHPGVYRSDALLIAQNRLGDEDSGKLVNAETLSSLFGALKWSRIEVGATAKSLVQEIWRWFLIVMLVAMVLEAILCMPKRRPVIVARS